MNNAIMNDLVIHATSRSPYVHLCTDGILLIEGKSIPVNASKLYKQVVVWVKKLLADPPPHIELNIKYEYCDSASLKNIFEVFKMIREAQSKSVFSFQVNWYYEEGDMEIFDQGEYLQQHVKVPFALICRGPSKD
jgi:hypothetical protein